MNYYTDREYKSAELFLEGRMDKRKELEAVWSRKIADWVKDTPIFLDAVFKDLIL